MKAEQKLKELGIDLPDYDATPFVGVSYGRMKPFHIIGNHLVLAGHVPEIDGTPFNPGRLGENLTTEQGYEAARVAGINVLAGLKQALDDLDRVASLIRTLNYVVCAPDYHDVHKVANGLTDLLYEVFGEKSGVGCRATLGIQSLSSGFCFETLVEAEITR
jgi:enamine deaminase RidA (YjgF/YER057c/UK114 family)